MNDGILYNFYYNPSPGRKICPIFINFLSKNVKMGEKFAGILSVRQLK